jgi:hypothetical protein
MTDKIICREPVSMSGWEFEMNSDFKAAFAKTVNEVVSEAFQENPPSLLLTSSYGGGPLTLSLSLPLGPSVDEDAIYDFDLRNIVSGYIDEVGAPYEDHPKAIKWVSDALRELADWMDTHIQETAA